MSDADIVFCVLCARFTARVHDCDRHTEEER